MRSTSSPTPSLSHNPHYSKRHRHHRPQQHHFNDDNEHPRPRSRYPRRPSIRQLNGSTHDATAADAQHQFDSLSAAAQKFKDYLLSPSCPLPLASANHSFQTILTHAILAPAAAPHHQPSDRDAQQQLTVALHIIELVHKYNDFVKYDALLRYRLSTFLLSLQHFLRSEKHCEQAFALIHTLLSFSVVSEHTVQPNGTASELHQQPQQQQQLIAKKQQRYSNNQRDISTISNILDCLLVLLTSCNDSHFINLYIPKLIPLLHLILFVPSSVINYNINSSSPSNALSYHTPPPPSFDYSTNDEQLSTTSSSTYHANNTTSDNNSNSSYLAHINNKLTPLRKLTLLILHKLCAKCSNVILPFWSLFFPIHSGGISKYTHHQRQTLAYLLLYDPTMHIRQSAISLSNLLVSRFAKPILLNYLQSAAAAHKKSTFHFIPISERILNTCVIFISVVATALKIEACKTVIPKLTKLINEVLYITPNQYIPRRDLISLLNILKLITCGNHVISNAIVIDKTIRAAAAKSLTFGIACLGEDVSEQWNISCLELICNDVISCIVEVGDGAIGVIDGEEITTSTVPLEELLNVLKSVVSMYPQMFETLWRTLKPMFIASLKRDRDFGKSEEEKERKSLQPQISLHVVRIVEMFTSKLAQYKQPEEEEVEERRKSILNLDLKQMKQLAKEVYRTCLIYSVHHPFQSTRISTIVSLDFLLQIFDGKSKQEHMIVTECVQDLCQIIVSESGSADENLIVKASAVKALGSFKVYQCGLEGTVDIVTFTLNVLSSTIISMAQSKNYLVTGRALTSFISIYENKSANMDSNTQCPKYVRVDDLIRKVALQAVLLLDSMEQESSSTLSASEKAHAEMCHSACIQMVTMYALLDSVTDEGTVHSMIDKLCRTLQSDKESINIRCVSCKCLGRMLKQWSSSISGNELMSKVHHIVYDQIGKFENGRIEGSAAKCMCELIETGTLYRQDMLLHMSSALLRKCGEILEWSISQLKTLDIGHKDRGQFMFLQKRISELIYMIVENSTECEIEVERSVLKHLVMGISVHFELSKYLTDVIVQAECTHDMVSLLEKERLTQDLIPANVYSCVQRLFESVTDNTSDHQHEPREV